MAVCFISRTMVTSLPNFLGRKASWPVFQRVAAALLWFAPSLIRANAEVARPLCLALTPRQVCRPCSTAVFPLPFSPHTKLMLGLQTRAKGQKAEFPLIM